MNQLRRVLACASLVAGWGLGAGPGRLASQSLFRLGQGGEVGGSFEAQRFAYGREGHSGGSDYRVWLSLPVTGSVFRQGFLAYQGSLQPTMVWQQRSGFDVAQRFRQLNLSAAFQLLAGKPVSLGAYGTNASSSSSGGLGSVRDYRTSVRNADLSIQFRPLPARFSITSSRLDETWRNPGSAAPLRNATVEHTYRFSAANSKLSLQAQRYTHDDLVRDLDYSATTFQAVHVLRWGHGSRLESAYETADQHGLFAYRRREWRERLGLNHSARVRTEYYFSRLANGNEAGAATSHNAGALVNVVLSRSLVVGAMASRQGSLRGSARERATFLGSRATVSLGRRDRVYGSANLLLGPEWRSVVGATGLVEVVDEPHEVPASRLVTLDRLEATPGGLVVRSGDRAVTYLEAIDYTVVQQGGIVQLRILPSSRIAVGDLLLVSYRYLSPMAGNLSALRADVSLSAGYRGLGLEHQRSVRRTGAGDPGLAGRDGAPSDFDDARTVLSFRSGTGVGRFEARASHRERVRAEHHATDYELSSSYTPPPLGTLTGVVSALWSSTRTTGLRQSGTTLSVSGAWPASRRLSLTATMETTGLRQSDAPPVRYLTGRGTVGWYVDRILIDGQLDFYRQAQPAPRYTARFSLRVTRRL